MSDNLQTDSRTADAPPGSLERMVRLHRGMKVRHARTGWRGWVYGAGPGRNPSRWLNPAVVYVDWYHRKPATGGHMLAELILKGATMQPNSDYPTSG